MSVKILRGQLEVNFESGTTNHSDISPGFKVYLKTSLAVKYGLGGADEK